MKNFCELVSIITPSYNSEKFISKTIDSVLLQVYKHWEMIIVDDCSSDNSNQIIEKYCIKDSRIKLIKLPKNQGAAIARNKAIEESNGRFIAFLDADDLWYPDKLTIQLEFMTANSLAFTYSSYDLIDEIEEPLGQFLTKENLTYNCLLKTNSIGCLTAIYDTHKLGKLCMPVISKRQDYALWLVILKQINCATGIVKPLATYRIRTKSISSNKMTSAMYQWKIYRNIEKISIIKSAYYFILYTFNGIKKYKS